MLYYNYLDVPPVKMTHAQFEMRFGKKYSPKDYGGIAFKDALVTDALVTECPFDYEIIGKSTALVSDNLPDLQEQEYNSAQEI